MMSLRDKDIKMCKEQQSSALRTITEESPIGSSASNGRAEAAAQNMSVGNIYAHRMN